uniref:Uncharacterized protein n=1 Tax=Romanomermis culicivorax TaxID=13658 RepID=A0A915IZS3_ROMCU
MDLHHKPKAVLELIVLPPPQYFLPKNVHHTVQSFQIYIPHELWQNLFSWYNDDVDYNNVESLSEKRRKMVQLI